MINYTSNVAQNTNVIELVRGSVLDLYLSSKKIKTETTNSRLAHVSKFLVITIKLTRLEKLIR